MELFDRIFEYLRSHGITMFAPIPLDNCKISKKYLLDRVGIEKGTAVICAVPYFTKECINEKNISAYAAVKDYHRFFKSFFDEMCEHFSSLYQGNKFAGFADHSPIDERDAALRSGLGVLGQNGLVITEPYSSFVFLGEFITDVEGEFEAYDIKHCIGCGRCKAVCPSCEGKCLSAITQKKGDLSDDEEQLIIKHNTVWGCDICQSVCPYTEKAIKSGSIFTNIDYFTEGVIPSLNTDILNALDKDSFEARAFSWRGRDILERNLSLLEKKK